MKRAFTLCLMLGLASFVLGQTTPREMVILEIGTGTWCTYCPGAAMGADDLVEGGGHVAVCENHNGDPFANNYSNARNTYYNISGYPTAKFDGVLSYVGGSHTASMIGNYYPLYLQRINHPSELSMSMQVTNSGLDYSAVITIVQESTVPAGSLKLRFAVTVSNISYNWQGQTHLNFVNALMVPDATGTTVDFTSGNTQTYTLNYSLDATWPVEDVEFIAFVQNDQGKEILQGIKKSAVDLNIDFSASTTQVNKNEQVTFTNLVTGGYIHSPVACHWFFPGATPDTSSQPTPTVTYTECGPHDVTLIVDKGGEIDTVVKTQYINVGPIVNITATPNDTICHTEQITLDATTPNAASYLWQPGGTTDPTLVITYPAYDFGTHAFDVTVTGNDGCVTQASTTIVIENCTGTGERSKEPVLLVSPNPNNGDFRVEIFSAQPVTVDLAVSNILGKEIMTDKGIAVNGSMIRPVSLANLAPGIYFVTVRFGEQRLVKKIVIN